VKSHCGPEIERFLLAPLRATIMRQSICSQSIALVAAAFVGVSFSVTIAHAGSSLAGQANSMEQAPDQIVSGQEEMPLDAFGYIGGLFEARFYEPHSTTGDPRDEIRQAASLYNVDLAMMLSIAKVESNFNPRARTGSYKGLFQLSDDEFKKYGDGSIWDARDNARAAAHMFLVQTEKFKWALGRYPDYAERYMVHQQGIEGAIEHYTHPERVAWQSMCATDEGVLKGEQWCRKSIWRNLSPEWKRTFGSVEKVSSGDFVSLWAGRINHLANRFSLAGSGVSPSLHPKSPHPKSRAPLGPRSDLAQQHALAR
jgi:Transglycosylase SLT domain